SYVANISLYNTEATLVEKNDVSRPTRNTTNSEFRGIELVFTNKRVIVSKNRIHNSHGGLLSSNAGAVGIGSNDADNTAANANIYKNNLIYDLGGTGNGTISGIYNYDSN